MLSWATGSISSGNLLAFEVIGSIMQEIAGNNIVAIGKMRKDARGNTIILSPKLFRKSLVATYSMDN